MAEADRAIAFMKCKLADPIRIADLPLKRGRAPPACMTHSLSGRGSRRTRQLVAFRLEAAERVLADPSLSLVEVALRSGHADQSALTRAMRWA